jgi:hypothetical protein
MGLLTQPPRAKEGRPISHLAYADLNDVDGVSKIVGDNAQAFVESRD